MRSRTTKGSVSMSIFIQFPVILACSLPSIKMSWKWAAYSGDKVIMEVSATTVANLSDNLFQTASRRALVTSGFPLLLTRSECRRTWVYQTISVQHSGDDVITKKTKIPAMKIIFQYMPVHTGIYQYILVYTSMY
jgi:hypothetical protein